MERSASVSRPELVDTRTADALPVFVPRQNAEPRVEHLALGTSTPSAEELPALRGTGGVMAAPHGSRPGELLTATTALGAAELVRAAESAAQRCSSSDRTVALEATFSALRGTVTAADGTTEARFTTRWQPSTGDGLEVRVDVTEHRSARRTLLGLPVGARTSPGLRAAEQFAAALRASLA